LGEGLRITRRELLTSAATGAGAVLAAPYLRPARALAAASRTPADARGMNVLMFLTDQDRAIQHFPADTGRRPTCPG
jgi:choline-sulfatase